MKNWRYFISVKDAQTAALLALAAITFLWSGSDYELGTLDHMGPRYLPTLVSILILGVAATLLLRALRARRDIEPNRERLDLRATIAIPAAIVAFALSAPTLGLFIAIVITTWISAFASREARIGEVLVGSVLLAGFCVVVFSMLLKVHLPILPDIF